MSDIGQLHVFHLFGDQVVELQRRWRQLLPAAQNVGDGGQRR